MKLAQYVLSLVLLQLLPLLASAGSVYKATHDQDLIDEQEHLMHEMKASAPEVGGHDAR